jgi:putative membrane protein
MKSLTILKSVVLATLIFSACQPAKKQEDSSETAKAQNDEIFDDRDDEKDADFIVNAVAANLAEINLAQLALNKSTDMEVKKMATMLETDHTKVLRSLTGYANSNGISVPTTETDEAMKDKNDLAEMNGKDFDLKWCKQLQKNHKNSIRKFESRVNKTEDVVLKELLSSTLPGLKGHLEMLQQHEERIN